MQTTLAQYNETKSQDSFALQNSKLLKVRLDQVTVQAKLGSMVAYQGEVGFEHAGSGGMSKMLKKAVTGEGQALMKVTGTGEVFLADAAQDIVQEAFLRAYRSFAGYRGGDARAWIFTIVRNC